MAGANMTDTPRTKDELLAIFADAQGPAQITPQDMRDLVVSGVQQDGLHDFTITETGLSVPVPGDGTQTFIPFSSPTVHWDPSNALQTSSHPSPDWWGMTIPAKAWALLDSGIWDVAVLGLWAS